VILLVNKGTEGWNCPSLFACALVRKLSSANNFVLQAATRCLRQVSGNTNPARIYLTYDNRKLLDSQLKENFGEGIEALNMRASDSQTHTLTLRKHDLPSLCVTQTRKIVARREGYEQPLLSLSMPNEVANATLTVRTYRPAISVSTAGVLQQVGERVDIAYATTIIDARTAAADLAAVYRLPIWPLYAEIKRVYRGEDVPEAHMGDLAAQIESQISPYEEREEQFEIALALLRPHVFRPADDGSGDLVTQISVPRNKEKLLFSFGQTPNASGQFGFHYSPYNLDSNPEFDFLEQMLSALKTNPDDVNDIYFTGGFTDPGNTEFYVEYQDPLGKWRTYTPDFLIHRKDGRWMLVEVKASKYKTDPVDGRDGAKARAARRWADMSPGQIKYEIFFAEQDVLTPDEIQAARLFIEERSRQGAGN